MTEDWPFSWSHRPSLLKLKKLVDSFSTSD
ncbi:hypothetical protein ACUXIS_005556 [Cytobacillus horneckiae]